ncbi:MAG: hypothetical protein LBG72_00780 [Spirochaetaceae bacterium]|jgi:hypothetical protein|nr:hypothetical protein [Spirochaetaceae bacterium]
MKKNLFVLSVLFLVMYSAASAQQAVTVVEFIPFTVEGMSAEEGMMIEDIVRDHIKKVKNIMLVFPGVDEILPRSHIDYVFAGKIYNDDDEFTLHIDVLDSRTQKRNTWKQTYRSSSDMALKAPAINYLSFFGAAAAKEDGTPETIEPEKLLGRWRGGGGIEQVFFFPGGIGRAYFSRGAGMEFAWRIEDKKVIIEQKSKNDPRYYQAPPAAAAVLTELAEPKHWELSLYDSGQTLRGSVTETIADYDGTNEVRLLYDTVGKAEWKKLGR